MTYLLSQKFIVRTYAFVTRDFSEKMGSYQELKFGQYRIFIDQSNNCTNRKEKLGVMYVLFENWLYLVKKNSVKKMEIIYCNCLNLINA